MRTVIQRVASASVTVDGVVRASIGQGLLVLAGLATDDNESRCAKAAEKIANIRIFEDAQGKMNLCVKDIGGSILLVPNFTLAGDAAKGRRPSFDRAMRPEQAEPLFNRFAELVRQQSVPVQTGVFRATMAVALVNDGPITIVLDVVE